MSGRSISPLREDVVDSGVVAVVVVAVVVVAVVAVVAVVVAVVVVVVVAVVAVVAVVVAVAVAVVAMVVVVFSSVSVSVSVSVVVSFVVCDVVSLSDVPVVVPSFVVSPDVEVVISVVTVVVPVVSVVVVGSVVVVASAVVSDESVVIVNSSVTFVSGVFSPQPVSTRAVSNVIHIMIKKSFFKVLPPYIQNNCFYYDITFFLSSQYYFLFCIKIIPFKTKNPPFRRIYVFISVCAAEYISRFYLKRHREPEFHERMRCALQFRAVFRGDDFLHGKTSAEFSRRAKLCRHAETDFVSLAEFCRFPLGIVFQSHGEVCFLAHIAGIFAKLRIIHRIVKIVAGAVFPVAHAVQLFIPALIEAVILAIAQISVYRGAVSIGDDGGIIRALHSPLYLE